MVFNFKQKRQNIVKYTKERDQLNAKYSEKSRDILDHQFITKLDDKGKIDLVQVYLGTNKPTISYADAKQVVEKVY